MKRVAQITILATSLAAIHTASAQLTYPIVGTGQSLFYDNSTQINEPQKGDPFYGQDAHHTGNAPSYRDNGDGTITDSVTGLMWQRGYEVMSYEEAMAAAESFSLGGYSDWRLPSIKEAYSLIIFSGVDASGRDMESVPKGALPFINTSYFDFKYGSNGSRVIDTQMLSSTIYVGSNSRQRLIFGVNMADGRIKSYPITTRGMGKEYTVRFVRGAEYGVNQFVDNGNNTISDTATGLMWSREDSGKGMDWQAALEYAEKMNRKGYLGYSDWRVPDAKELQSIVDYTRSPESSDSAAIDPMFKISHIKNEAGERDYPYFWSSTTHCAAGLRGGGGAAAAYLSFGRGLGNMAQMQMGSQMGAPRGGGAGAGGGARQNGGGGYGGGNRQHMPQQSNVRADSSENWINIHGAGCQRSDPKSGDAAQYAGGRGPQGDAIRIENYVRLVRDL